MVWVKVLVLLLLLAAIISLFTALTSMLKDKSGDGRTVRALAWRVGFCVLAFGLLVLSMLMGWVKPHGVNPYSGQSPAQQQVHQQASRTGHANSAPSSRH